MKQYRYRKATWLLKEIEIVIATWLLKVIDTVKATWLWKVITWSSEEIGLMKAIKHNYEKKFKQWRKHGHERRLKATWPLGEIESMKATKRGLEKKLKQWRGHGHGKQRHLLWAIKMNTQKRTEVIKENILIILELAQYYGIGKMPRNVNGFPDALD